MKNLKKRNWAFVLYPESAPTDWRDLLQSTGIQAAISPLHDKDINPDGQPKKAHYHVIITYSNTTTYNSVKELTDRFNCPIPQPLEQVRGYYRYLTHKDNPEKFQYNEDDITTINGFDILEYVELTTTEVNKIKVEIQKLIRDNLITEYADLMDLLLDSDLKNYWDVASNHTYFFDKYISSIRNKLNKSISKKTSTQELNII